MTYLNEEGTNDQNNEVHDPGLDAKKIINCTPNKDVKHRDD